MIITPLLFVFCCFVLFVLVVFLCLLFCFLFVFCFGCFCLFCCCFLLCLFCFVLFCLFLFLFFCCCFFLSDFDESSTLLGVARVSHRWLGRSAGRAGWAARPGAAGRLGTAGPGRAGRTGRACGRPPPQPAALPPAEGRASPIDTPSAPCLPLFMPPPALPSAGPCGCGSSYNCGCVSSLVSCRPP